MTTHRLETIASRNKKSLTTDIVLAALLAVGLTVSALIATGAPFAGTSGGSDRAVAQAAPIRG